MGKDHRFRSGLVLLTKALVLIWKAAPGWSITWIVLLAVQGLLPVAVVFLTRSIVDGLVTVTGTGGGWAGMRPLMVPAVMMGGVLLVMTCNRSLLALIRTAQSLLVEERISDMVHEKSIALDLACYESSTYFDRLFRARNEGAQRPLELVDSMGSLLQNGLTLIAMAAVLTRYSPWVPAALIASTLPVLYVIMDHRSRQHAWRLRNTEKERRALYYDWLITSRENAAEIRLFGTGDHFREAFRLLKAKLRKGFIGLSRSQAMAELLAAVFALLITGFTMAWMAWRVIGGSFTLGDLALFFQAFNQGQQLLRSLLENVGQMYGSSLFLADFFEFLGLESRITSPQVPGQLPHPPGKGIRFEHIRFRYPFTENDILKDFSLEIPAGKITAIVGPNGAGKSTLVKLLCRLYDPDGGRVTVDDIDLRAIELEEVRRMVTVLFQDPVRYNLTVAENIRLGDLSVEADSGELMKAAEAAGADGLIAGLKQGLNTRLGRWFPDSTDLSGGEWQRLALARAFLRKSPVIVLDEPTGAMDSWSEMDWLERFRKLASGRTVLVITHRFTTAMHADVIHVMDHGAIVETGTHRELLARNGRYAASWNRQMRGVDGAQ